MLENGEYIQQIERYVVSQKELFTKIDKKLFLITGAAGLIGSYIVDLIITANKILGTNIKVYALDKQKNLLKKRFDIIANENLCYMDLDVNTSNLPNVNLDYVIHAASNTSPTDYAIKPIETMRTNLIGTDNMLNFCIKNKVEKFLFCSSVEVYGQNNGDTEEFGEEYSGYIDCNTLRAGYPTAKRASEALCNAYAEENKDFAFNIARIGRIYGPTVISGDSKAPTQFINDGVSGRDIVLKSDGLQHYSYCYVGDCATALLYILIYGKSGEAYNIADPNSKSYLKDFAKTVADIGGSKVIFTTPTSAEKSGYSKITKAIMDTNKLENLGWRPLFNLFDGINSTVRILKALEGSNAYESKIKSTGNG